MCFLEYVCIMASVYTCWRSGLLPPPPNTYTHAHIHLDSKEKEVWIMLDLRNGQANKTHLETIEDRAQKQRKVSVRVEGRKERSEESPPSGEQSSCSLLSQCPFTHPHKLRHKQTRATVHLIMPASLAANHSAQTIQEG